MTLAISATLIIGVLCAFFRINLLVWLGLCFWVVCAAGAGAIVGALVGHVAIGAIGGALCCISFMSSLVSNEKRNLKAAAANEDARMRYQAQLNAEAMVEVANRARKPQLA